MGDRESLIHFVQWTDNVCQRHEMNVVKKREVKECMFGTHVRARLSNCLLFIGFILFSHYIKTNVSSVRLHGYNDDTFVFASSGRISYLSPASSTHYSSYPMIVMINLLLLEKGSYNCSLSLSLSFPSLPPPLMQ